MLEILKRNWWRLGVLLAGIAILAVGIGFFVVTGVLFRSDFGYFGYGQIKRGEFYQAWEALVVTPFGSITYSLVIMFGGLVTVLGAKLLARRFSLKWLLLAVFMIALLGSVPFLIGSEHGLQARMDILYGDLPTGMNPKAFVDALEIRMNPKRALQTLPGNVPLGLPRAECVRSYHFNVKEGDFTVQLEFDPRLSERDAATLSTFYADLLAAEVKDLYSTSIQPVQSTPIDAAFRNDWDQFRADWEKERQKPGKE